MNSYPNKYEGWLYGLAFLVALALRFIQLGAAPLTDSEATLALQAFHLAKGQGFIHCSTISQVLPVAENFYKGQKGLVLLVIDPALLSSTLRWELPFERILPPGIAEGETFPHIYGPLNLDAVVKVADFEPNESGIFALPKL